MSGMARGTGGCEKIEPKSVLPLLSRVSGGGRSRRDAKDRRLCGPKGNTWGISATNLEGD